MGCNRLGDSAYALGVIEPNGAYRFMHLSDEEVANVLAFPAIRESSMDMDYASVVIHHECGEVTTKATTWLIEVTFRLLAQPSFQTVD
jgi:hypothetical protein